MRVLHILDHTRPIISGYSSRTHYILSWQKSIGIHPTGLSSPLYNTDEDEKVIDGVRYLRCNSWSFSSKTKRLFYFYFFRKRIKKLLLQEKFDLLHAHSPSLCGISAILAKNKNIPFIYEVRAFWEDAAVDQGRIKEGSLKYKIYKRSEDFVLKRANAIVVICKGLKEELVKRGFDEDKIFIVPNGIDLNMFDHKKVKENDLRKKLNISDEAVVGFIGSFYRFEGLDLLIRAVEDLNQIKLLLVGDGEKFLELKKLVSKRGLGSKVIFTGRVPHQEVINYYSVMDLLVYPRKDERITRIVTPLKPLEAMALGKVVIGSDVDGVKEIIGEGKEAGGILFKKEDVDDLKSKIKMVLNNKNIKRYFEKKALERAKKRSWDKVIKRYLDVYEFAKRDKSKG